MNFGTRGVSNKESADAGEVLGVKSCFINKTVLQTNNSAADVKVTFDEELDDVNDIWDTSTSRLTPGVSGNVYLACTLTAQNSAPSANSMFSIYKNGSPIVGYTKDGSDGQEIVTISYTDTCTATDFYELFFRDGSGSVTVKGATVVNQPTSTFTALVIG